MDPGHKARKNPSDNVDLGFFFAYEKKNMTEFIAMSVNALYAVSQKNWTPTIIVRTSAIHNIYSLILAEGDHIQF